MFTNKDSRNFRPKIEGAYMRPLAFEKKTIRCEFKVKKAVFCRHTVIHRSKPAILFRGK